MNQLNSFKRKTLIHSGGNSKKDQLSSIYVSPMRITNSLRRSKRFAQVSLGGDAWRLSNQYSTSMLRRRLKQDGYLYLPQFLDETEVREARRAVLLEIQNRNGLSREYTLEQAVPSPTTKVSLLALPEVSKLPLVARVVESPRLFELFRALLDEPNIGTLNFKWLRAVANGEFTGVHIDRVFVGQQTERILTAWIPIGDVPIELGSLTVCKNSHLHDNPDFEQMHRTYGKSTVGADGTTSGWLSENAANVSTIPTQALQWLTTNFKAGDILVLHIDMLHMTLKNVTNQLRISWYLYFCLCFVF